MRHFQKNSHSLKSRQADFEKRAFPLMDQLYRTALYLTQDDIEAEDLTQLTYLRAWKYYDQFDAETNFRAWIFRILRNNFINEYRRNKRRPLRDDFEKVAPYLPAAEESALENEELKGSDYENIFDDTITDALKKIPEHYRSVVLLSDVSNLPYKEIAEVLDCPIGTVMSRLHRGRTMLARFLKSYAQTNGYLADKKAALLDGGSMLCPVG
ncbi:MAG: sigma-70 family RNA polymerase sigma factor [Deferribacteres bacterium]|nr:sigma-70 family RNA polymerase sigma factor [candidate division KSB1 bacterium]MCB9500967.1 sigma-70 family RNA polymerase sigma factor [Deferribacteres bacterium]